MLVEMLINHVSRGGNLLLNVGPTARGEFDYRALDRLNGIGQWMRLHSRAIYGCTFAPAEFTAPLDCRYTYNPATRRLYVHCFSWPFGAMHLPNMAGKVAYAQLLNDASEIHFADGAAEHHGQASDESRGMVTLHLPVVKPPVEVPVIEIFLK
jgi:alpha-L-fucosidase